jgi:hypothetical protein
MPVNLLNPVLSSRTKSINFFNGRLLAGEDLTTEQQANRFAHALLGQAAGDGVVYGLDVTVSTRSSTVSSPVLAVTEGLAINKNGGALLLDTNTEVALVRPANNGSATTGSSPIFQDCTPVQNGAYIAGAGVYLLTIGPATAGQGLAEVSGVSTAVAACNTKYNIQGVQFRLLQLNLTQAELSDTNHLQNLVAYKFFAPTDWAAPVIDPFGTAPTGFGLLDQLRAAKRITGCEVPLAVLYWTATDGLVFADMWAVRRPVFSHDLRGWSLLAGKRHLTEGLARFFQFQTQVTSLVQAGGVNPLMVQVTDYFRYLPALGFIPIGNVNPSNGFDYLQFFTNRTYHKPVFVEGARLEPMLHSSFEYPPIDLNNQEMIWVYQIRENQETIDKSTSNPPRLYMLFTNGHMPFQGDARYDLNYWNYANFM